MTPATRPTAAGFVATAVAFGPARMGFGLFLPAFREEFALSTSTAGLIASGGFLAFLLALPASAWLGSHQGQRMPVIAGAFAAAAGFAAVAAAGAPGLPDEAASAVIFLGYGICGVLDLATGRIEARTGGRDSSKKPRSRHRRECPLSAHIDHEKSRSRRWRTEARRLESCSASASPSPSCAHQMRLDMNHAAVKRRPSTGRVR